MITPGFETTQLSSSNSVRIAALGAGLQGKYGAVARIVREFPISRPSNVKSTQGSGENEMIDNQHEINFEIVFGLTRRNGYS